MEILPLMRLFLEYWQFDYKDREPFLIQNKNRITRIFIQNTCTWMQSNGGCSVCNYSCRNGMNAGQIIDSEYEKIKNNLNNYNTTTSEIKIYMGGSYFCEKEISFKTQVLFLKMIQEICNPKRVTIETRPEYITEKKLEAYKKVVDNELEIAIGLETTNDNIRKCFNKGFSFNQFEKAIIEYKELCNIKTYLLFKPPFVSESDSIKDVILSIKKLLDIGLNNINITAVSVQKNTLLEFLLQERLYRPSWLWSIIELNTRLKNFFPNNNLGMTSIESFPTPILYPFNCEKCSKIIFEILLKKPNTTWNDIDITCDCKNEWDKEISKNKQLDITNEIAKAYNILEKRINRNKYILSLYNKVEHNSLLKDVAKEIPNDRLKIDFVGIQNFPINLKVNPDIFSSIIYKNNIIDNIFAHGKCNVKVSLDEFHRGIHMSRIVQVIENFLINKQIDNFREDFEKLGKKIRNTQNGKNYSIEIKLEIGIPFKNIQSKLSTILHFGIYSNIMLVEKQYNNILSLKWPFLNACPCTLELSKSLDKKNYFTHMQKGLIEIKAINNNIEISDMLKVIDTSIMVRPLLKREDEYFFVKKVYEIPEFCEDTCRRISKTAKNVFHELGGSLEVIVQNDESIHNHMVRATKHFSL